MLTPIDIQNKTLKAGMGYKKSDVDELIVEIYTDYDTLYRKNAELREKMHVLSEGIQYYKKIEKSIQGALMLAEQTAAETQRVAEEKAAAIIAQANNQAAAIVADAKRERGDLESFSRELLQEYERYRLNFRHMMSAQIEMLDSEDGKLAQMKDRLQRKVLEDIPADEPAVAAAAEETETVYEAVKETVELPAEETAAAISEIDALREEGKELSEKMAAMEMEGGIGGDLTADEEQEAADAAQIEDFVELAATKDLSAESLTIMEMLKKAEEERSGKKQD